MPIADATRRSLCNHLGRQALELAPRVLHSKCQAFLAAPPLTPGLPYGSLWGLVNHLKVLHQYTELVSEAASLHGQHALPLAGTPSACTDGLEWFAPLCCEIPPNEAEDYCQHVQTWRASNPGLFSHAEAAFHVHQGYAVEDRNMTRSLVRAINPKAKEYEVDIAGNILQTHPDSFDDFLVEFRGWRSNPLYHLLRLAARNMPHAAQWVPERLVNEADDWQDLLDRFNQFGFCSPNRLQAILDALARRPPALSDHICSLLDRAAILARVKSNGHFHPPQTDCLDDCLSHLAFKRDEASPYAQCQLVWGGLKRAVEDAVPPSLLCPSLYPPNRGTWGYRHLQLRMRGEAPYIHTGPLSWIDKEALCQCKETASKLPNRLHDILLRMGEAATAPEVAHLMLDPKSLAYALCGLRVHRNLLPDYSDRSYVLQQMDRGCVANSEEFSEAVQRIVEALPKVSVQQLPAPMQLLAWRVDCPPRAILYLGESEQVDLSSTPPYTLPKILLQDKLSSRTVSGISVLSMPTLGPGGVHTALRACIAEEVVGRQSDFCEHPQNRVMLKSAPLRAANRDTRPEHVPHTTTTLAEAVSLFTGPPPNQIMEVPLHASPEWDEEHIDHRYAERQLAANGSRFRDWLAVYHDPCELQRCRLASHEVRASELYHTHFPLVSGEGQSWVSVMSTVPPETVVLRHQQGKTDLESLKRSVNTRFMHDGKLLPVRSKGDKVHREHMEIYSDEAAGQVLIAYAPQSAEGQRLSLEFISFMRC